VEKGLAITYIAVVDDKRHKALLPIAVIFCVFFVFVPLFSTFALASHAAHDHDQDGPDGSCSACAHVQVAENVLKAISVTIVVCVAAWLWKFSQLPLLVTCWGSFEGFSLVALKIKLNN
jgi:ABC-type sulfate transport system permease component